MFQMSTIYPNFYPIYFLALFCSLFSMGALAQDDVSHSATFKPINAETAQVSDIGAFGDLQYNVDFDLPSFFGISPGLSLNYSSSNPRFGSLSVISGPGWVLSGFSQVVLSAENGGLPVDSTDELQVDGRRLKPCPSPSPSASCSSGGNHYPVWEDYRKYVESGNTFTVFEKNGVQLIYQAFGADQKDRFLLTKVQDTHGNEVNYEYTYFDGIAYPYKIIYGSYEVEISYINRSDQFYVATGLDVHRVTKAIRRVEVTYNQNQVRAYTLDYYGKGYVARVNLLGSNDTSLGYHEFSYGLTTPGTTANGFSSGETFLTELSERALPGIVAYDYDKDGAEEIFLGGLGTGPRRTGKGAFPIETGTPGTGKEE